MFTNLKMNFVQSFVLILFALFFYREALIYYFADFFSVKGGWGYPPSIPQQNLSIFFREGGGGIP